MPAALRIHLNLETDLTIGDLRAFLELAAEAPNTEPLEIIYNEYDRLTGIAADLVVR